MVWYAYIYICVCVCAHTYMCIISMLLSARKSLSYSCFLLKGAAKKTLHLAGCIEPVVFIPQSFLGITDIILLIVLLVISEG